MFDTLSPADLLNIIKILEDKYVYLSQLKESKVINENWKDIDLYRLHIAILEIKDILRQRTDTVNKYSDDWTVKLE